MKTKKIQTRYVMQLFAAWAMIASVCGGCTEQNVLPPATDDGAKGITLTLPIATAPMEGSGFSTRAEEAKSDAEKTIKNLWLLQFDGTDDGALLLQCTKVYDDAVGMQGGSVTVEIKPGSQTVQSVYLLANHDVGQYAFGAAIGSLDKADFNTRVFLFSGSLELPAEGLPMSAYQEFDPMRDTPTFTLKAMVAKVIFTCNMNAPGLLNYIIYGACSGVNIRRVPNGANAKEPDRVGGYINEPHTPPGLSRDYWATIGYLEPPRITTVSGTYYVSENLAGRKTGLVEKTRGLTKSPVEATYIEITSYPKTGGQVRFVYFLGAEGDNNDFNVVRNHVYKVTMDVKGVFKDDERITYF